MYSKKFEIQRFRLSAARPHECTVSGAAPQPAEVLCSFGCAALSPVRSRVPHCEPARINSPARMLDRAIAGRRRSESHHISSPNLLLRVPLSPCPPHRLPPTRREIRSLCRSRRTPMMVRLVFDSASEAGCTQMEWNGAAGRWNHSRVVAFADVAHWFLHFLIVSGRG
jgi:hypothetical protein